MIVYKNVQVTADCEACGALGEIPLPRTWGVASILDGPRPTCPCPDCEGSGRVPVPAADLPSVLASLVPGAEEIASLRTEVADLRVRLAQARGAGPKASCRWPNTANSSGGS